MGGSRDVLEPWNGSRASVGSGWFHRAVGLSSGRLTELTVQKLLLQRTQPKLSAGLIDQLPSVRIRLLLEPIAHPFDRTM